MAGVAVIGISDHDMGEAVKAVVRLADSVVPDADLEADLIAYCRAELATYKCPPSVDFVEDLPRDPNVKLYKRLLRDGCWVGSRVTHHLSASACAEFDGCSQVMTTSMPEALHSASGIPMSCNAFGKTLWSRRFPGGRWGRPGLSRSGTTPDPH